MNMPADMTCLDQIQRLAMILLALALEGQVLFILWQALRSLTMLLHMHSFTADDIHGCKNDMPLTRLRF